MDFADDDRGISPDDRREVYRLFAEEGEATMASFLERRDDEIDDPDLFCDELLADLKTLKDVAEFLELYLLSTVAYELAQTLDLARQKRRTLERDDVEFVFAPLAFLVEALGTIAETQTDVDLVERAQPVADRLREVFVELMYE
ncbi:MAG: hypothetical protein GF419_07430 [Ignavibacteriales bacterium]|nr:hypothetical protein [Ignavibacteriales bacterium]